MKPFFVATRNSHKTEEIQDMLGNDYHVTDLNAHPELTAVEETGTTFLENATLKAVEISRTLPGLILSDDSGLEVDALNGEPGVYSSRYAGEDGNDAANNAKLLHALEGVENRTARFRCVMVLAEKGKVLESFDGKVEGRIIDQLQGTEGFGYDPLFIPEGFSETFAELGNSIKSTLSHRARAMAHVTQWLANNRHHA